MRIRSLLIAAAVAAFAPAARAGLRFEPVTAPSGARVNALAADGATLWAGTYRGVWKLAAGSWALDGLGDRSVTGVAVSGGSLWAATGEALFRRGADGTWVAEVLPAPAMQPSVLAADGDTLYAGGPSAVAGGPVLLRRSAGVWTGLPSPGAGFPTSLAADTAGLLVGLSSGSVSRLSGASFSPVGGFVGSAGAIQAVLPFSGIVYAGTASDLWFWNGGAWAQDAVFGVHDVRALTASGGILRAATADAGVLRFASSAWTSDSSGLLVKRATSFAVLGSDLYVGTGGGPVYRYSGGRWSDPAPGSLQGAEITDLAQVRDLAPPTAAAMGAGLSGATLPEACGDVFAVARAPQSQGALAASACGPLLESAGFSAVTTGLPSDAYVTSLTETPQGVVAGTASSGIWRFVGSSWSADNAGLSASAQVGTVRQAGTGLYAFVNGTVLSRGASGSWTDIGSGLPDGAQVTSFSGGGEGGGLFAGLSFGGVFRRDASSWRQDSAGLLSEVWSLDTSSGRLFAAAGTGGVLARSGGAFRPERSGLPAGVDARVVRGFAEARGSGTTDALYAGTAGRGLFRARTNAASRAVPVILDVVGIGGARFRTELTIGARGAAANLSVTFTPAAGFGKGTIAAATATVTVGANAELRIADAFDWLRSLGLAIPPATSGNAVAGTLTISAVSPSNPDALLTDSVYAIARTYTAGSGGTYGLFYDAPSDIDAAEESAAVYGLRSVAGVSRSNLALVHLAGRSADPITLSVQVYDASGNAAGAPVTRALDPGDWTQINGILGEAGLPDGAFGYARITRTAGSGPWLAYGVVNDAATSDGSYLAMQRPGGLAASRHQIVPVVLDVFGAAGSHYTTELTLVNDGPIGTPVDLTFEPAPGFGTVSGLPQISVNVPAHAQVTLADVLQTFREKGVGVPRAENGGAAGTLSVDFRYLTSLEIGTTLALARTTTPNTDAATGGAFGLFYPAVAVGGGARTSAVVPALRQDSSARSNLAVVHVGGGSSIPLTLSVQLYDAQTGGAAGAPMRVTLQPGEWKQWASVITAAGAPSSVTSAYAVITRTTGDDTFFAYGVQNDAVTSDGSYVAMIPAEKL